MLANIGVQQLRTFKYKYIGGHYGKDTLAARRDVPTRCHFGLLIVPGGKRLAQSSFGLRRYVKVIRSHFQLDTILAVWKDAPTHFV